MIFLLWNWLVRFDEFVINNLLNIINIEHHIINRNIGQSWLLFISSTFPLIPLIRLIFISQIRNQIMQLFFPELGNF